MITARKIDINNFRKELLDVYKLTYDQYSKQGYCQESKIKQLTLYPHLDLIEESSIYVIYDNNKLMGTVSLTHDGPNGIHTDIDFPEETEYFRNKYKSIGSSWRIITSDECKSKLSVVSALIQSMVTEFMNDGIDVCLNTFNPKHEAIYKRILNMETYATKTNVDGLDNAPAVLMIVHRDNIPEKWLKNIK